jgi:electron transfer flavoprotein alpha subunit
VANIVVFIEVRDGATTVASRYAVSEARRMATELGATVYAVMALGPASEEAIEGHARVVGEAGADRILCCSDAALDGALLDATAGAFLASLGDRLRPVLTIFPAGDVGAALGPPLALRLGALYHARASLEVLRDEGGGPRLSLRRFRAADGAIRALDVAGVRSRPVVATLPAGLDPGARGEPAAEVEMLAYVAPKAPVGIRELSSEPDDATAVELAPALLAVGADVKDAELAALRAAAPAGTVVVREGERPVGLDHACPARLLVVGKAPAPPLVRRTLAPGSRVAVAGGKSAEKDLGRIDVVWRPAKEGLSPLAAALSGSGRGAAEAAR